MESKYLEKVFKGIIIYFNFYIDKSSEINSCPQNNNWQISNNKIKHCKRIWIFHYLFIAFHIIYFSTAKIRIYVPYAFWV